MSAKGVLNFQKQKILKQLEGSCQEDLIKVYQQLEEALKKEDPEAILAAYLHTATIFFRVGETEEAFRYIDLYKEVCTASGSDMDWLKLHQALYELYQSTNDTSKARETLNTIIVIGEKLEKHNIVSSAYANLSQISLVEEDYTTALEMAEKGLLEAKLHERESAVLQLNGKLNKAEAQIGLWNFKGAKKQLKELGTDSLIDEFIHEKIRYYELQGRSYAKRKKYKDSFDAYTKAKEMAENFGDLEQLKRIQEERCQLGELIGDIELGFKIQKEYITLLTEIHKSELAKSEVKLEIQHSIKEYERRANTDFLTGLYNRSYIETTMDDWLRKAAIIRENLVCIVFDIDDFKAINDEHGHLFGDEAIKLVSQVCADIFREEDLVGRFGGDEFVVILRGTSLEVGKKKAEQLTEALKLVQTNKQDPLTISIGIADNKEGTVNTFKELFHLADMQLYKAKQSGKNRIIVS